MSTELPDTLAFQTAPISPLDEKAIEEARARQNTLTKPAGSLGRLEELSILLAGIQGSACPEITKPAVVVAAGSHGVAEEGVSAFPSSVTAQMVENFLSGGAAINALARANEVLVSVVDAGVDWSGAANREVLSVGKGLGTKNFFRERAMTAEEAILRVESGYQHALQLTRDGVDLVLLGDMGIGNTTSAAAIAALVLNKPVAEVTGTGTGVNSETHSKKISVIKESLEKHSPNPSDGIDILSAVGGFEIAFLAGCTIGAAAKRIPVVIDGFPTSAAALLATLIQPETRSFLLPSHRSQEPGHNLVLAHLGLRPLFDFQMRLGEGTGAVLAVAPLRGACAVLREMATFSEANVDKAD